MRRPLIDILLKHSINQNVSSCMYEWQVYPNKPIVNSRGKINMCVCGIPYRKLFGIANKKDRNYIPSICVNCIKYFE